MGFYLPFVWAALTTAWLARALGRRTPEAEPWHMVVLSLCTALVWAGIRWDELSADPQRAGVAAGVAIVGGLLIAWVVDPAAAWIWRRLAPALARAAAPIGVAGRAAVQRVEPYRPRLSGFQFAMWLVLAASLIALVLGLGPVVFR